MSRQIYVQQKIACSHATLPVVCVVAFFVWFFSSTDTLAGGVVSDADGLFMSSDYGLWHLLPLCVREGFIGKMTGVAFCALCIYAMAELNNSCVLLRVSSRMLSSMLAILISVCVVPCLVQPGLVVMLFCLLSFFALFASCQLPSPMHTLLAYLSLSLASMVFPKALCLVPVYWTMQAMLRSFSFRCLMASIIATLIPYWFFAGLAVSFGWFDEFMSHVLSLISFHFGAYEQVSGNQYASYAFAFLLFLLGTVDFVRTSFKDKTRVRLIYNAVIVHGVFVTLFATAQPQYMSIWQSVMLVDSAILFGHFFTLVGNRFTNILMLVLAAAGVTLSIWNH